MSTRPPRNLAAPMLTAIAIPGDDALALTAPVPPGTWVALEPRSTRAECLPVFECHGADPVIATLGVRDHAAPGGLRRASLTHAHPPGTILEITDVGVAAERPAEAGGR